MGKYLVVKIPSKIIDGHGMLGDSHHVTVLAWAGLETDITA